MKQNFKIFYQLVSVPPKQKGRHQNFLIDFFKISLYMLLDVQTKLMQKREHLVTNV